LIVYFAKAANIGNMSFSIARFAMDACLKLRREALLLLVSRFSVSGHLRWVAMSCKKCVGTLGYS
jgi:hypothetical protein